MAEKVERDAVIELEFEGPLLLYDGDCGFCSSQVRFILAHERQHSLCFASLAGDIGQQVRARFPELEGMNSLVWLERRPGRHRAEPLVRSDAVLAVGRYLGGPWRLVGVLRLVPRPVRDLVYRLVARHRPLLPGANGPIEISSEQVRGRFLDRGA